MNNNLTTISVSYESKEILIELDPFCEDTYTSFIKILSEKIGIDNLLNNYKIMAINTNIPYLLIDENNFWNILHEERKEEILKLFMNKLDNTENNDDDEEDNNDEPFLGGMKSSNINNDFDDFNEEDFDDKENSIGEKNEKNEQGVDENNNEKDNENAVGDNIDNNPKIEIEENKNEINQIEDKNNELIIDKDENINEKNSKNNNISNLSNIGNDNNIGEDNKEKEKEKEKENEKNIIIKNVENENENIDEKNNIIKKKDLKNIDNISSNNFFKEEVCSICEKNLENIKNICIICDNIILCRKCGEEHDHPCLLYKTPFISSLEESYNFMTKNYNFHSNKSIKKKQRNISIYLYGDENICLRPKKGALIPIKIMNNSHATLYSHEFIILVKGNKLINITYDSSNKFTINPYKFYILKLKCLTPNKLIKENINLELYSNSYNLKDDKKPIINFSIEINEDKDEENMNFKLFFNEMGILYNKEHKKLMISLLENEMKGYKVDDVIDLIIHYNWDKEKLLKLISSFNNKEENSN